jgi:hypothetical protein
MLQAEKPDELYFSETFCLGYYDACSLDKMSSILLDYASGPVALWSTRARLKVSYRASVQKSHFGPYYVLARANY